jgi:mono/diheme cytochrome c family protein
MRSLKMTLTAFMFVFFLSAVGQDTAEETSSESGSGQEEVIPGADLAKGEELFKSICASCHKRYEKAIGPALHGLTERREMEWIYKWIKNNKKLRESGDQQAIAIYEEYNKTAMPAYPQLSNQDIDNIVAYAEQPKPEPKQKVAAAPQGGQAGGQRGSGMSTEVILGILAFVLLMLSVVLYLVNRTLNRFAEANGVPVKQEEYKEPRKPIWVAFAENQFLVVITVVVVLLGVAYGAYGFLMQVGVDQGYEPVQPIHYSHRIHAGENKIECKYCHSSARVSKHSGIPSLNVCMNCHEQVNEVAEETATAQYSKEFYDKEIQKLYEATGWNPDEMAYTDEKKPVKWVRIHNLPDLAYFNHSQHVTVANIECQKCHGPVEEMEIMYQHSSLTMGWCINCHRETQVNVKDNGYYKKIHEELSKKYNVDKVTAAQMGGIECGKCHY